MRNALSVVTGLIALAPSFLAGEAARSDDLEARLRDHYVGKIVTAKLDLPRTDGGFLFINDGEIDTVSLQKAIQGTSLLGVESGGVGVPEGSSVVIGDLKVRDRYVEFLLATSRGAEWTKALDTLSGSGHTPHSGTRAEPISGSGIVIVYGAQTGTRGVRVRTGRPLRPEELTIDALNACLSKVIDTRPLLSLEGIPDEHRVAIQNGQAVAGMDKKALFLALGEPKTKQTELSGDDVVEKWLYERDDLKTILVILTNGKITTVREY